MKVSTNYYISHKNFKGVNLKFRKDIKDLTPCDKLVVLAHPDDETCFFGFINKLAKNIQEQIQLIYLTSGQKGRDERGIIPRYDARMKEQRLKELEDAMNVTGVTGQDPLVLDMMDGETHFKENRTLAQKLILDIINKVRPKEIYTFDQSGITGHTDHIIASRITGLAIKQSLFPNCKQFQVGFTQDTVDKIINMTKDFTSIFLYSRPSINEPDRTIDITEEIPETIEAFSKYKSQFTGKACKALKKYFEANPYIDLRQINNERRSNNANYTY